MEKISKQQIERFIEGKLKLIPLLIVLMAIIFFLAKVLYELTLNL